MTHWSWIGVLTPSDTNIVLYSDYILIIQFISDYKELHFHSKKIRKRLL